tara:strand:+ start:252 stop:446 length:195 start_codon:yes stop_codon:yes gene_type:complete
MAPFVKGTGVPELKSRPALLPKYQTAASFCEKDIKDTNKKIRVVNRFFKIWWLLGTIYKNKNII